MSQINRMKELVASMTLKNNYWGYLFSLILRVEDDSMQAPMGVRPERNGTVSLVYNPSIIEKMSDDHIKKVLEHEGLHIINKHVSRFLRIVADEVKERRIIMKQKVFNMAADCCVNTQIADMPKALTIDGQDFKLCFPESFKMDRGSTTEIYYEQLLKEAESDKCYQCLEQQIQDIENGTHPKQQNQSDGNNDGGDQEQESDDSQSSNGGGDNGDCDGEGSDDNQCGGGCKQYGDPDSDKCQACNGNQNIDDHTSWSEASEQQSDPHAYSRKVDDYLRDIIHTTAKDFRKRRGNLPAGLEELIDEALLPPKVPYYQIIKKLVTASRFSKFRRHYTKINRKRTWVFKGGNIPQISPFPGRSRDFSFEICICVDTSGSMSRDDLMESLSGIKTMIDNDRHCLVHVIEIDTQIQKEYQVKKLNDIDPAFKGRGGTELILALERAKDINADVTLFFTDGWCEDINTQSRSLMPKKLIWIITEDGSEEAVNQTGYVVRLDS